MTDRQKILNEFLRKIKHLMQKEHEIQQRIKKLIILAHEDSALSDTEKQAFNSAALKLLAENTGCAEEAEIVEGILDDLFYERQIINQKDVDDFYAAAAIARWL